MVASVHCTFPHPYPTGSQQTQKMSESYCTLQEVFILGRLGYSKY